MKRSTVADRTWPRQQRLCFRRVVVTKTSPTPNFDPETGEWAWDRDDRLWRERQARLALPGQPPAGYEPTQDDTPPPT
jgi:hypothetical protein